MKKKILLFVAIVAMLVCVFAISASALDLTDPIDGIYYSVFESNGVYTASVNSKNQKCALEIVDIPEEVMYNGTKYTVTKIADQAFGSKTAANANKTIKEVIIPKTVSSVDTHCFRSCTNLEKVTMKAAGGAFSFSNAEFWGCTSLKTVDFSEAYGLRSIGAYAFTSCPLEIVLLPEGLEDIASDVFAGKTGINEIVLPSTLKKISGKQAFASTAFTSIVLPKGLTALGNNVFQFAALESIVIPAGVTSVGEHCFNNTKSLKYVVIANPDVTNYNSAMFYSSAVDLIFFAGTEADARTFAGRLSSAPFTNFVSYEKYLENPNVSSYTDTIVYGTQNCAECGNLMDNKATFKFTNFISEMKDSIACTCGEETVVKSYDPILVLDGWSAKIDGDRVCLSYTINKSSLAVYEEKTSKEAGTVKFGVVAAAVADGTTQFNPLNDDLTVANDKIVSVAVDREYASFDFILSGFTADYYEKLIVMCAYVYDGSEIYYVDSVSNTYATPFTFSSLV